MSPPRVDHRAADWLAFVEEVRRDPSIGFEVQWARFLELSAARDPALGPLPTWVPDPARIARSGIGRLMAELGIGSYDELHRWSTTDRAGFWRVVIERLGVVFSRPPETILDLAGGATAPRWLPGARLNIADSCFLAEGCATALVQGREGSDRDLYVTYGELEALVNRVANGLAGHGLGRGARIALYMPMNLECVAAYLGVVRAGGAVVSIADSFAARELARRLEIAGADAVVTVDVFNRGGRAIPLYGTVREAAAPRAVVIPADPAAPPDLRAGDLLWDDLLGDATPSGLADCAPDDLTNVLFSSGTTGDPKAIPWTHLTPLKCAADGWLHQDIGPGSVVCWPTNIGWMMGPWLVYASLVNRGCMALYEGLPGGPGFARFVERAGVTMLGVVPSLVRAWRTSGVCEGADWSRIEVFSSTGEPSNRQDYLWLTSLNGYRAPVVEYCGGTEIGGGYITGAVVQPASPATFTTPALGLDLVILDDAGRPVAEGEEGEVFLVPPSIGLSQALLNRDHDEVYYRGCPAGPNGEPLRRHGDRLARLPGGFYRAQGRADDTMNLGGIKVSSLELERVVDRHPAVAESAAVAVQPGGEGAEALVVFAVLAAEVDRGQLLAELRRQIARDLNPLFKIHDLVVVDSLPRTASNKLMRRELRGRYD
ncbi:MAG: AMP-binding protein [Thermoanaerobaculales bacterium]|jgi:acetyl-CoA synthetase|nr:AMP-binding protein [Thermoanaerobaculales bacterium]